ncbi:hypothetical protein ACFWGN_14870 [Oerskovia sp. NPDC060338]|uniref:hypothetical protein n=1 Tax=Oerskovia sp. NPDC060338 TaxID=3347100 RepID=UPI003661619E
MTEPARPPGSSSRIAVAARIVNAYQDDDIDDLESYVEQIPIAQVLAGLVELASHLSEMACAGRTDGSTPKDILDVLVKAVEEHDNPSSPTTT